MGCVAKKELYGRLLTWPRGWLEDGGRAADLPKGIQLLKPLTKGHCTRCGGTDRAPLPQGQSYCLDCLALGRVSTRDVLVTLPEPNAFEKRGKMIWTGELTEEQAILSEEMIQNARDGHDQLLVAVTGAGKTEMLFCLIDWALSSKQRVGLVSPRVDVLMELAPRIEKAFDVSMQVLYGEQTAPYRYTQLVLATTHQLLRFYRAFDLLLIDEVDAFPFRKNSLLERAVERSLKKDGRRLLMTATPSKKLLRAVHHGQLRLLERAARYHGHPLPEITCLYDRHWEKRASKVLKKTLAAFREAGKPFFLFVPRVRYLLPVLSYVQALGFEAGTTVHANDPQRLDKVQQMRAGQFDYLVTTTILERGVTVSGLQVVILGADDPTFSKETLVQMAGRVGRSAEDPVGQVLAIAAGPARSIRAAQKEIRMLNRKAEEKQS
ncbi:DEAD/DEAH box helicase family protein [Fructobacillus sp. M1-13]|uniref:DEAD/DEAH box helicase family protein n=1 Tax=Fructobacillus papyriferae TaxID=2713171 RepID=A0ABS5QR53_9LACO|nr:helicase-related protein [Fructobacillus papyriferae]MBS9335610.1 DEAD/DEAH box helicase family protein [Fructobacillus papyriferae]MCD2159301.1 DEAD/DEAH box helicase family protein [Fructobacillus papyriferae]